MLASTRWVCTHARAHTLRARIHLVKFTLRCGIVFVGDNPVSGTGEPGPNWGVLSAPQLWDIRNLKPVIR